MADKGEGYTGYQELKDGMFLKRWNSCFNTETMTQVCTTATSR
jgi:hypothetical protein